jgi:hypothetical protein
MAAPKCLDEPSVILKQKMCLNALSKIVKGLLELNVSEPQKCAKPKCVTLKTGHKLTIGVGSQPCDSKIGKVLGGGITVDRLITAYEQDGLHRGFHAGDFVWKNPNFMAAGRISGMTNVGTHRKPIFDGGQKCDQLGVMEGRICGQIMEAKNAELKGCQIFGVYRFTSFKPTPDGGKGNITGYIEGVVICPCQQ